MLFDTTVAENISLGKQNASREEVQMAAKDANAHGFVSTMPEGYGTCVGKCNQCNIHALCHIQGTTWILYTNRDYIMFA